MGKFTLVFLATLFVFASSADITSASDDIFKKACQYFVNGTEYNLLDFSNIANSNLTYHDFHRDYNVSFHLCNRNVPACGTNSSTPFVYAVANDIDNTDQCLNLTSAAFSDSPVASYINSSNATEGLVLTFPTFGNGTYNSTFVVELQCDSSIAASDIIWQVGLKKETYTIQINATNDTNATNQTFPSYTWTITGAGSPGCPNYIFEFFTTYKYLFGVVFLAIGLFALLAGIKFFNVTIYVFTTTLVTVALCVLILEASPASIATSTQWIIFALCFIVGLGVGYAAVKIEKVGFFALGALLGGLLALFLYTFILHFFDLSEVILYVVVGLFSIIGGGLALWLWKDIIILATSCIGSYLSVRGVSFIVGGFPNELDVAEGNITFDNTAYGYLIAIVVVAVVGIVYQYKKQKKDGKKEEEYLKESLIRQEYY